MARFTVRLSLVLLLASAAFAQGILPFSSQATAPVSSVDIATGSIVINIPVRNKPGQIPFDYALVGNSAPAGAITPPPWTFLTGQLTSSSFSTAGVGYQFSLLGSCGRFYAFTYTDSSGALHKFSTNLAVIVGPPGCPGQGGTGVTTDGSGFTLILTPAAQLTYQLFDKSGNYVSFPGSAPFPILTDPDGDSITEDSSGHFTDTLGQTALTVTYNGGPSSDTYVYADVNGTNRTYTVIYSSKHEKTVFGCSDVDNAGKYYPTSVTTPAGNYTLTWETTPGYSPDITGRIQQITLPSGGYIKYEYSGGTNGYNCTSHVVPTLKRTIYDGSQSSVTTYVNSNNSATPGYFTVTETTPTRPGKSGGDTITHYFSGEYEMKTVVSDLSLGTLSTTTTCYNGVFTSCGTSSYAVPTLPIKQTDVYSSLGSSTSSLIETIYDCKATPTACYGLVTETKSYNAAAMPPSGSPVMDRKIYYGTISGSNCVALGNYIYDHVCADEYFPDGGTSVDKLTEYIRNPTGHPTKSTFWVSSGSSLSSYATYNGNGTIATATDVDGAVTTFNYDGSCNSMVVTSTTLPTVNVAMSTSATWYCAGGVPHTTTDVNGGVTTYTYNDPLWRTTNIAYPNGGSKATSYFTTSGSWYFTTSTTIDSSGQHLTTETDLDGLGRTTKELVTSDTAGSDEVDTAYDLPGRVRSKSNPHRSTGSDTDGTTTYDYDAMGRTLTVTLPDSNTVATAYNNRTVNSYTEGSGTERFIQTDDLGRMTSICEVMVHYTGPQANGASPVKPCNSDFSTNYGFVTSYTYDELNRLVKVSQSGLKDRTFAYDGLDRLTSEYNPESGTKSYTYDTQNAGDLYKRTAPLENQVSGSSTVVTTYTHDKFHRLTFVTYDDGSTNPAAYYWDVTSWLPGDQKGRMVRQDNAGVGGCGGPCAGEEYSYDIDGNIVEKNTWTPSIWPGSKQSYFTYNYLDQQTSMTDIWGYTYTTAYDAVARPSALTSSLVSPPNYPGTLFTVQTFNPLGQITSATLGNGVARTLDYDHRGRLKTITDGSVYSLTVGYSYGNVSSVQDSIDGNWTYAYDDFNRLATSSCTLNCPNGTNTEAYAYTYDQFGNRWTQTPTAGSGIPYTASFDTTGTNGHNQFSPTNCTGPASNFCYDIAGNLLYDGAGGSQLYDAEGRLTSYTCTVGPLCTVGTTGAYSYDGAGQRVERSVNSVTYAYAFDNDGRENTKGTAGFAGWSWSELYMAGLHVNTYASSSTWFSHNDHLGTLRTQTDPSGNAGGRYFKNRPFGDGWIDHSTLGGLGFTDLFLDYPDGYVWHTPNRQYNESQGRWMRPDPAGMAAVDPANPQTWNRYAYVVDSPLNFSDASGLDQTKCPPGSGDNCVDVTASPPPPADTESEGSDSEPDFGPLMDLWRGEDSGPGAPPPHIPFIIRKVVWQKKGRNTSTIAANNGPQKPCPAVPAHPANANVNSNISLTNVVYYANWLNPPTQAAFTDAWLVSQVRPNGPWDYKTQGQQYDAFGNFNFGATGAAAGIPLQVLQAGAGAVSTLVGTNSSQYGSWYQPPLYGHAPIKSDMIAAGYAYYQQGCK